jgi:hypothetical protein
MSPTTCAVQLHLHIFSEIRVGGTSEFPTGRRSTCRSGPVFMSTIALFHCNSFGVSIDRIASDRDRHAHRSSASRRRFPCAVSAQEAPRCATLAPSPTRARCGTQQRNGTMTECARCEQGVSPKAPSRKRLIPISQLWSGFLWRGSRSYARRRLNLIKTLCSGRSKSIAIARFDRPAHGAVILRSDGGPARHSPRRCDRQIVRM